MAVEKWTGPVAADARLGDRHSMLFKGTSVTRGSGVGVVVATGVATELGHISKLVEEAEPETSPLERRLTRLSGQLVWAVIALTRHHCGQSASATGKDAFLMVEAAIALAVAAIPEGLPIVATLALARGMLRMARQNALIERLSAVETLGATTVILTDKTGTLTENRMTVARLWVPSGEIEIDGGGDAAQFGNDAQIASLLEAAVLCNDATLGDAGEDGTGDPMELALLRAGTSRRAHAATRCCSTSHCAQGSLRYRQQDDGDRAQPRRPVLLCGQGRAGSGAGRRRARDLGRRRPRTRRHHAQRMGRAHRASRPSRPARARLRYEAHSRKPTPTLTRN